MSARLSALHPRFQRVAQAFVAYARRLDPSLVVTSTRRSDAEQQRLYARFLAGESGGIPAAPPGRSKHGLGLAFDLAPYNRPALDDPVLAELGAVWKSIGGEWHPSDPVHFAVPGSIEQLRNALGLRSA